MKALPILITSLALSGIATGAPTFDDDVFPIFKKHCTSCHNPDKRKADLDLTNVAAIQLGSSGGEVVKAGVPDTSVLYMVMDHHEDFDPMPPKKPKLEEAQLKTVHEWIAGGLIESAGGKSQLREMTLDLSAGSSERPEEPAVPTDLPEVALAETQAAPPIVAMAKSPWADVIATSGHEQVLLYGKSEGGTFERIGILPFPEGTIHDLKFSPNGALLLAAGGVQGASGSVVVFDVATGARQAEIGTDTEQDVILSADITPDHRTLAIGTPARLVKLFSLVSGIATQQHKIQKHTDWVTRVRFSPDGKSLATGDRNGGIYVWETATGGILYTLDEHKVRVTSLAWRADGAVLASAADDGKFVLWDMKDGWPTRVVAAHVMKSSSRYDRLTGILDLAFARDGRVLTTGRDKVLKLWAVDGGKISDLGKTDTLPTQATFGETVIVTGGLDGSVRVWDVASKKTIQSLR